MGTIARWGLGILVFGGLVFFIGSIIWLIIIAIKKRSVKIPLLSMIISLSLSIIAAITIMYFWKMVGNSDYVLNRYRYDDYERTAKNINILYHATDHSDSVNYDAKVKIAKKELLETVKKDQKMYDSKRARQSAKLMYDTMINFVGDEAVGKDNIKEYGISVLNRHILLDGKYKAYGSSSDSKKYSTVTNYFDKQITK